MVTVAGVGYACPPAARQDDLWRDYFAGHYTGVQKGFAKRIFEHSGVVTRHGVINPILEDVSRWSTRQRMERYLVEAVPLGKEAAGRALGASGLDPRDVGLFAVCSCTGYVSPGLDILLARDLGMSERTQRLFIGHMGCYAALPGLGAAADFVTARGRPALLLCLELPSLHVQPATRDPQQIIAHSLFSDAAAAVVLLPSSSGSASSASESASSASGPALAPGLALREVTARTDTTVAEYMTWDVTDLGFRMGLSPKVPDALARHVAPVIDDLLGRHGLARSDVDGWVVHPGGPRILDVVRAELDLDESDLAVSRQALAEHGNCSSPTVLLILAALRKARPTVARVVMIAFGPGLTLYAALLGPD
jgi:alkylresorcinol/alkylpyrone synthase